MGVMPVPHFRTLYVSGGRVNLEPCELTIGQLGRFHLTTAEKRQIKLQEKEGIKAMAFAIVKKSSLPTVTIGRKATEPRITVAENGRIVMNSLVSKQFGTIDGALLAFDPDTNRIAIIGLVKEGAKLPKGFEPKDIFDVKTDASGQQSIGASGFLREVAHYDYAATNSQNYLAEYSDKMKAFIITLTKELPARKPTIPRKPKVVATPIAGNGAVASVVAAPKDDDLVKDDDFSMDLSA